MSLFEREKALDAERVRRQDAAGWSRGAYIPGTSIDWRAEALALEARLAGAVSDEAAQRFRDALAPGYVVWHDGKRLSPEDTLTQIKRGLIAASGGQCEGAESPRSGVQVASGSGGGDGGRG